MKKYLILILLINLIGFSCKKKNTQIVDDAPSDKPATPTGTDSVSSAFMFSVNGVAYTLSDTVTRDSSNNRYNWIGRNSNSFWLISIQFSGTATVLTSYSIFTGSLQTLPGQCFFALLNNTGGGIANTGAVTISAGNPKKISLSNILVSGTQSSAPVNYTVSGTLPLY